MKTLKQIFNKMVSNKDISDTGKEFLHKLFAKIRDEDYKRLEYNIKSEGELYTFCFTFDDVKYEFYTDDYLEFRAIKRIVNIVLF